MSMWVAYAVLFLLTPSVGRTQDRPSQDPCVEAASTAAQRDCAGRDYRAADADLNAVYRQALSALDDDGHETAFQQAQRAWLKYRDAVCEYEGYRYRGGTIYSVIYTRCLTRMTVDRTAALRASLTALNNE